MKKLITILAILIVLVGAVFATTESHSLAINACVDLIVPQFQLKIGSVSTNIASSNASNKINDFGVLASYSGDATPSTGTNINLSGTGTAIVEVIAYLANAAKTAQNYTLTFQDGVFTVKRNGTTSSGSTGDNKNVIPTITTEPATNNGFSASGANGTVSVDFNGKTCAVGNIVVATYSYQQEDAIDPDTYTATVTLEIATT